MSSFGLPGAAPDRGGVWPIPFEAYERTLLLQQAKSDRRNIPPLWFWRFLTPDELPGTVPNEAFFESPLAIRKYDAPVPVHLYVNWQPERKGKSKATTETTGEPTVAISRAEARRLGARFKSKDDTEGLVGDVVRQDVLYVPRPGDLFFSRNRYYQMLQLEPRWAGATSLVVTWEGTCAMVRDDMGAPGFGRIPAPSAPSPPLPEGLPWRAFG